MLFKKNNLNVFNFFLKKHGALSINKIQNSFFFLSLISPFLINNFKLNTLMNTNDKKIFIKQSYMLMTWFFYISQLSFNDNKKRMKIAMLPKKKKIFTLTKSPIAHKNWSKEQYVFQYYTFRISFKTNFKTFTGVPSTNAALLFTLLTKKSLPYFETNLLFLKSFNLIFYYKDFIFFNYYFFLNNN